MSEYYVPSPTVYIFMIYAVIFVPSVLLLDNWALKSESEMFGKQQ